MFGGIPEPLHLPLGVRLALRLLGFAADALDLLRELFGAPAPSEPAPLAVALMREIVLTRGIRPLQELAHRVDRSVVDEYATALLRLTEELAAEGYHREAEQVFFLLSGGWR